MQPIELFQQQSRALPASGERRKYVTDRPAIAEEWCSINKNLMFGFKYQKTAFVIKNPDFDNDISTLLWEYMVWGKRQTLEAVRKRVKTHVYGEIKAPDQIAKIIQEEYSRTTVQYAKIKGYIESSYQWNPDDSADNVGSEILGEAWYEYAYTKCAVKLFMQQFGFCPLSPS